MNQNDWNTLITCCLNKTCGDPVMSLDGSTIRHTKRQMVYAGSPWFSWLAVFVCPVCGSKRYFRPRFLGSGFYEVSDKG